MQKKLISIVSFLFITLVAVVAFATPAQADVIVTLDTTPLQSVGGTWYLDFQLADGDGVANNTVGISGLSLGGGSTAGAATLNGGASGTFPALMLTDSDFFNEALIPFVAGSMVTFVLSDTNNFAGGFFPDTFTWAVLDGSSNSIVTNPFSLGAGLVILLDGTAMNVTTVAADAAYNNITPQLSSPTPEVPEPATGVLLLTGLGCIAIASRRRG
jgi:hypothetical protein